jgi:hypothetical protein
VQEMVRRRWEHLRPSGWSCLAILNIAGRSLTENKPIYP